MSTIVITLDPLIEQQSFTKPGGCCGTVVTEDCEVSSEPLKCGGGDQMILFFTDPSVVVTDTGIILGDIISRVLTNGQYVYTVFYDDALLAPAVPPDTLVQADLANVCCYDCASQYSDQTTVPGFETVRQEPDCALPGVDVSKMVRAVSLNGTELIVDAAPEHFALTTSSIFGETLNIDITLAGSYLSSPSPTTVINNPSNCREFRGLLTLIYSPTLVLEAVGRWRVRPRISIDGGGMGNLIQITKGAYGSLISDQWFIPLALPFVIPPGGSFSYATELQVTTLTPSPLPSTFVASAIIVGVVGGTA